MVDYCLVSHDCLSTFCDFEIIRTSELISRSNHVSVVAPTRIPDHSVLTWKINLNWSFSDTPESETLQTDQTFDKFDVSAIPSDFLSRFDVLCNINEVISKLEQPQRDIDSAFSHWCGIV